MIISITFEKLRNLEPSCVKVLLARQTYTFCIGSLALYPKVCNSEHVLGFLNVSIFSDMGTKCLNPALFCACAREHCLILSAKPLPGNTYKFLFSFFL